MTNHFFPPDPRLFPGQRGINILLRTAHLVGVAGIGGGFLFGLSGLFAHAPGKVRGYACSSKVCGRQARFVTHKHSSCRFMLD